MNGGTTARGKWYQFQLKDAGFVCLIVALIAGWWTDRGRLQREFDQTLARIQGPAAWSIAQILGEPDTPGSGDIQTAWASATPDGQREWLILEFAQVVTPTAVEIHETYNPGAVDRVSMWNPQGQEVTVWTGVDPTPATSSRGISLIPVRPGFKTSRVKIYLDSPKFPGWNEIDAVGLRDTAGKVQWAARAAASSSFGGRNQGLVGIGGSGFSTGIAPLSSAGPPNPAPGPNITVRPRIAIQPEEAPLGIDLQDESESAPESARPR